MKRFVVNLLFALLTLSLCGVALGRPKEFRNFDHPGSESVPNEGTLGGEPSCEELRAMWRFSKRQSRAAEVTNELPTYRDPFAYNVWEPLPRLRSVLAPPRRPSRPWSPPVYGRIVRHPPLIPPPPSAFDELYRELQKDYREEAQGRRRQGNPNFRLSLGSGSTYSRYQSPFSSFDRLKELILAERAKDLQNRIGKDETSEPEKNGQEGDDENNDQNENYTRYTTEEEENPDKSSMIRGGLDMEAEYAPERYRKPLRRTSGFNWEDSSLDGRLW